MPLYFQKNCFLSKCYQTKATKKSHLFEQLVFKIKIFTTLIFVSTLIWWWFYLFIFVVFGAEENVGNFSKLLGADLHGVNWDVKKKDLFIGPPPYIVQKCICASCTSINIWLMPKSSYKITNIFNFFFYFFNIYL